MQQEEIEAQQGQNQNPAPPEGAPPSYIESTAMTQFAPAQSNDRFVIVPVTFLLAQQLHIYQNTISVDIDLQNPPTYDKFLDKISAATVLFGPLPHIYKERDMLALAGREFRVCLNRQKTVLFIWSFAPPLDLSGNHFHLPRYVVSDAYSLTQQDFV